MAFPKEFAQLAWPDAEGWQHSRKCGGYGSHRGGGMYVAAGCHLGILERCGLVWSMYRGGSNQFARRWALTDEANILLDAHEATKVESP